MDFKIMQVYLVGRSIHYVKAISLGLEKQLSNKIFYFIYAREKNLELSKQQDNVEGKKVPRSGGCQHEL